MFSQLMNLIIQSASMDFTSATKRVVDYVDSANDFLGILEQIGTIPEFIEHDSTDEKLYAKASDAVLSRAFREVGLKSCVLSERGDSADVLAESIIFGYTLVADAKAFRLSRTAKNQKDFKVTALSGWRKSADYAVLCAPGFQYPKLSSQIYAQSLEHNVCLLSWENLIFMVRKGIKEDIYLNLASLWNYSGTLSSRVIFADRKKCFLNSFLDCFLSITGYTEKDFVAFLSNQATIIENRGIIEKDYWNKEKAYILTYTREEAIRELIKARKIDEKIKQIDQNIRGLRRA